MNYALIGFGGLGKVHFKNMKGLVEAHPDVKLVAICDVTESTFTTNVATNLGEDNSSLDLSAFNLYTDYKEMLDKEDLDFVVAAVPTYLHDVIAIDVMNRGINMFSEKPMAISLEKGKAMLEASEKNNVKLMIGQCLRFWPEYKALKEIIDSGKYGKVIRANFARLSPTPVWGWENWYMDGAKSGGAALDLHVHDVDFVNYAFGKPKAVTSVATNFVCEHDSIITSYDYDDKVVIVNGDWTYNGSYPFTPSFTVRFEKATVEMKNGKFAAFTDDGVEELEAPGVDAYLAEMIEFVSCIKEDRISSINPPSDTVVTLEIALAEKKSADLGEKVVL